MNQLGLQLKQRGLDAVEHSNPTWVESMRWWAKHQSRQHGKVSADDVRRFSRQLDWQPESPNAYGAIFRGKHWQCIGRKKSEHPGNHSREIRVWKWV